MPGNPSRCLARPPLSGSRFERVDEVYFFVVRNGLIDSSGGIEEPDSFPPVGFAPGEPVLLPATGFVGGPGIGSVSWPHPGWGSDSFHSLGSRMVIDEVRECQGNSKNPEAAGVLLDSFTPAGYQKGASAVTG